MVTLLYPFLFLAALGFLLSLALQVLALAGLQVPSLTNALSLNLFTVYGLAVLINGFSAHRRRYGWKHQLSGCPRWMRWGLYALLLYLAGLLFTSVVFHDLIPRSATFLSGLVVFHGIAFVVIYARLIGPRIPGFRACHRAPVGP